MIVSKQSELGEQPLSRLLAELHLRPNHLVEASDEQITHKMVRRGCKGRRLTRNVQTKLLRALNSASGKTHLLSELFTY